MRDAINLIGYSSDDDEFIFGNYDKKLHELFSPFIKSKKTQNKSNDKPKDDFKKYIKRLNTLCCYCECVMRFGPGNYQNTATKDHVIPKHKGGKITKPCCFECNQEKGGLMLHSYIQMLNLMMLQVTGDELVKLQTKIKNANRITKEINSDN